MASSVLGVALTGLNAAQTGMRTTAHNVANVNTVGYSRQEVLQSTASPLFTGSGYLGSGTQVETVRRVYSETLQRQAENLQAQAGQASTHATELDTLNGILASPESSLSGAIDAFFGAVQQLAAHPADIAARQSLLSAAEALTQRFLDIDTRLSSLASDVNQRIVRITDQVNALGSEIARLNDAIITASAGGQPPNDLLDRRDAAISELNTLVGARAVAQSDGSLNVFLSNGEPLVVGTFAQPITAASDPLDPSRVLVGRNAGGSFAPFRAGDITGGELGGLLDYSTGTLAPAQNAVGQLAMALGAAVNTQLALGQDLYGAAGTALFRTGAPHVGADARNTGSGTVSATVVDPTALTAEDYLLRYDGAAWEVTRLPDGARWNWATLPQTTDGVTFDVAGAPAAGDRFLVQPSRYGASSMSVMISDPRQIAAAAPVRVDGAASNLGTVSATSLEVGARDPNLLATVTLRFTGANSFDVSGVGTGNPTGLAYAPGTPISFNGWTIVLSGVPRAGDVFTVGVNTAGVGDNRNALKLAALATADIVEGTTPDTAYASTVAALGARQNLLQSELGASEQMLGQARDALSSVSGVNLDEEAANLLRYQQAYQAASKAMVVANSLFDEILALFR